MKYLFLFLCSCVADTFPLLDGAPDSAPDAFEPAPDVSVPPDSSADAATETEPVDAHDASEASTTCGFVAPAKCGTVTCSGIQCCQTGTSQTCSSTCYNAVAWGCESSEGCGTNVSCCANQGTWNWVDTSSCPRKLDVAASGAKATCMATKDCSPVLQFCQSSAVCPSGKMCERTLVTYAGGSSTHEVGVCR